MKKENERKKENSKVLIDAFLQFITDLQDEVIELREMIELLNDDKATGKLFYTFKELTELTGLTHNMLKGRVNRGTLEASKDGNVYLVSVDEVNRFVAKINADLERKKKRGK